MTPEQQHQRDIVDRLRKRGEQLDELAAAEITRLTAALEEAEKRGYDAAKEQAAVWCESQSAKCLENAKRTDSNIGFTNKMLGLAQRYQSVSAHIRAMVKP